MPKDSSLAGELTSGGWKTWGQGVNALASALSGGKKKSAAKPGQASNLKASDYANQKPYIAPGSNWGDGQKKSSGKKAPMKDKKKKLTGKPNPFAKGKPGDKAQKPGFPAKKKKKK